MFGYLQLMSNISSDQTVTSDQHLSTSILSGNDTHTPELSYYTTTTTKVNLLSTESSTSTVSSSSSNVFEIVRFEIIGIVITSALMIIFFLGLIGAFLESILCLRIFGAILSYLFLLTFGAALYIIILLVISRVPTKLILSTMSCSAVAITLHAALAIAPFAFADLINQVKFPNQYYVCFILS